MENTGKINPQDIQIQGLVDGFLSRRTTDDNLSNEGWHLDEDLLSAFVEGNLNPREAQPIVSHLVDCSFCRHNTAELVRLDLTFAGDEIRVAGITDEQPSRISEVLNGLLSRIFGTTDATVFAHQEDEDKEKNETKEEK